MTTTEKQTITIQASINAPVEKVWQLWTEPRHITQWSSPSPEWHTPRAESDFRKGGKFVSRMEAVDGSMGFDFGGEFDEIKTHELIGYTIGDGRKVVTTFESNGDTTEVTQTFEPESENSLEMQRGGWQAILDSFKRYAEYANIYVPQYFSRVINAPKKKVWDIMLNEETYKVWSGAAWPESFYEGVWKEGELLGFFNPERSGTKVKLLKHRPYEFTLAEHVAVYDKGVEDTQSAVAKSWVGSRETYTFTEKDGKTTLDVVLYMTPEWQKIFATDWPKAIDKLKELCEA